MNTKRTLLRALAAGALVPGVAAAVPNRKDDGPRADYFPNAVLTTHEGKQVKFYDDLVRGKRVIFNMMYTMCTSTCPPNTLSMLNIQQALGDRVGKDIFMYSMTLLPELDTPALLADYRKQYGIKSGWTFLTGKRADIDLLRRKLGFYDPDPQVDADVGSHTGLLRIGHEKRDRWFSVPAIAPTKQIVTSIINMA